VAGVCSVRCSMVGSEVTSRPKCCEAACWVPTRWLRDASTLAASTSGGTVMLAERTTEPATTDTRTFAWGTLAAAAMLARRVSSRVSVKALSRSLMTKLMATIGVGGGGEARESPP